VKSERLTSIVTVKVLTAATVTTVTAIIMLAEMQHLHYIQQSVMIMKSSVSLFL